MDVRVRQQRHHVAVQRGVSHHHNLRRLCGGSEVAPVVGNGHLALGEKPGRQRVHLMERRRRGRFRNGGHVLQPGHLPRLIARNHQGVAGEVDVHHPVVHKRSRTRQHPRAHSAWRACASRQCLRHERGIQGHVDVYLGGGEVQRRGVDKRMHLLRGCVAREDALLPDGLARAGADEARGAVRADDGEGGVRHVRLDERRVRVGHGGARRHHHRHMAPLNAGDAEGGEGGGAFINTHVHCDVVPGDKRVGQR